MASIIGIIYNQSILRFINVPEEIIAEKISLPTALKQTVISMGGLALKSIINTLGTTVVAAYGVVSRIYYESGRWKGKKKNKRSLIAERKEVTS
ncbi:MAG: hypothetical protein JJT76_09120 [Clostridiaceae bacterium]|nr:hypothetical protein [Clostridiaceae bacterium]